MFCDFCKCDSCKFGESHLSNAQTEDDRWICDVCWLYEVCMEAKIAKFGKHDGPCDDRNCEHRPKLKTEWTKFNGKC